MEARFVQESWRSKGAWRGEEEADEEEADEEEEEEDEGERSTVPEKEEARLGRAAWSLPL